jgi:microcystin-dependent protein
MLQCLIHSNSCLRNYHVAIFNPQLQLSPEIFNPQQQLSWYNIFSTATAVSRTNLLPYLILSYCVAMFNPQLPCLQYVVLWP